MTADLDFDRQVTSWLDASWPSDIPADVVDAAVHEARSIRRPGRAVRLITGPRAWPSNHEAQLFGRRSSPVRVLVVAALIATLIAASLIAGSQLLRRPPSPFPPLRGVLTPGGSVPSWFTLSTHATLLADGRVLVQAADGTMYAWGPSTRSFESLGTTGVWREQSTLLAMPDDRVAVVGGDLRRIDATSGVAVASTISFFDPETGDSSPAVPMNVPRYVYDAILLRDGRILAGGGSTPDEIAAPVATTEIFDPASSTWSVTASFDGMSIPIPIAEFPDGRVLVVGSGDRHAAIYDPSTDRVSKIGGTTGEYVNTAVTLADGRVLVGEHACGEVSGAVDASGHSPNIDPTPTELFDPSTGAWSDGPAIPHCTSRAAVLADGQVLYTGWWYERIADAGASQAGLGEGQDTRQVTWAGLLDPTSGLTRIVQGPAGHYLIPLALPGGGAVLFVTPEEGDTGETGIAQVLE